MTHTGIARHLIVACSLLAFALVLLATSKYGAFLSPDSVTYLSVSESLRHGKGLHTWEGLRYELWPPLFPAVLSVIPGRILNAVCFALIVALGSHLVSKYIKPPLLYAVPLCIVFSVPLLFVSSYFWSEPLFVVLSLALLLTLHRFTEKGGYRVLVLAGGLAGLAYLTRYIGIVGVGVGALVILGRPGKLSGKCKDAALFLVVAALFIVPWVLHGTGERNIRPTPVSGHLTDLAQVLAGWLVPIAVPQTHYLGYFLFALTLAIGTALLVGKPRNIYRQLYGLAPVALFAVSYVSFLVISETLTPFNAIDFRLMAPAFVPILILTLRIFQKVGGVFGKSKHYVGPSVLVIVWIVLSASVSLHYALDSRTRGGGGIEQLNKEPWPLIQWVRENKLEGTIYTNVPHIIWYTTGLKAYEVDAIRNPQTYGVQERAGYVLFGYGEEKPGWLDAELVRKFGNDSIWKISKT